MLLASGSLTALASCGLPPIAFAALASTLVPFAARALIVAGRGGLIELSRGGAWRLEGFGRLPFEGRPVTDGYRGSTALVLVLERTAAERANERRPALGRRRRLVVYADSVSASDFSLLHLHLAFPAETTA